MGIVAMWSMYPLFPMRYIEMAFKPPLAYVLLYASLALGSTIYSPIKPLSAWKSIEILVDTGLATIISVYLLPFGTKRFLTINHITIAALVIVLELEALINPTRAFRGYNVGIWGRQLGGIYPSMNPSMFGYVCAVASAMSLASLLCRTQVRERVLYTFLFLTSTLGTILCHSRSSMIANAIAILAVSFVNRKYITTIFFLILILATIFIPQTQLYWLKTQDMEQFKDMSGRFSSYWPSAWKIIKESPVYGHGFYASLRVIFNSDTTDNFFLDIFMGLGMMGLTIMSILILSTWKGVIGYVITAWRARDLDSAETAGRLVSILIVISAISITTRGFSIHSEAFIMFMTVVISLQALRYGEQDNIKEKQVDYKPSYNYEE